MKEPGDYIGCQIKTDVNLLPVTVCNKENDDKIVYCQRFEPLIMGSAEHAKFHNAGAAAYEIYVICSNNIIDAINYRIEQTPCSCHSHAPHNAPAWMFPEGAMFDIDWEDIILPVRKRMLLLLEAFVSEKAKSTKTTPKQTSKSTKKPHL